MALKKAHPTKEFSFCNADKPQCVGLRWLTGIFFGIRNTIGKGSQTIWVTINDLGVLCDQIKGGITETFDGAVKINQIAADDYILFSTDNVTNTVSFTAKEIENFFEGVRTGHFDELLEGRVIYEIVAPDLDPAMA